MVKESPIYNKEKNMTECNCTFFLLLNGLAAVNLMVRAKLQANEIVCNFTELNKLEFHHCFIALNLLNYTAQ